VPVPSGFGLTANYPGLGEIVEDGGQILYGQFEIV